MSEETNAERVRNAMYIIKTVVYNRAAHEQLLVDSILQILKN